MSEVVSSCFAVPGMKFMRLLALSALAMALQGGLAEAQTMQDLLQMGDQAHNGGRHLEAMEAYRRAIALDPKDASLYIKLADTLRGLKKYEEAVGALRQAISLGSKDQSMSYMHGVLAYFLIEQGKLEAAEAAYRQAVEFDPKNADLYMGLASVLREQGEYVAAEAAYRKAITLNPANLERYRVLVSMLNDQKRSAEAEAVLRQAEAVYRRAIKLSPKDISLYLDLASVLHERGKYVAAEAVHRQVMALDPKNLERYKGLAGILSDQKKSAEAQAVLRQLEAKYRQAIELDPKDAYHYNNLGYFLQENNRLIEARDYYKKSLKFSPNNRVARSNLEEVERLISIAGGTSKELLPDDTTYLPEDPLTTVRRSVLVILPFFSGTNRNNDATQSDGLQSHGTGFVVRREGDKAWILTARHVIRDPEEAREAVEIKVELYGGNLPNGVLPARLKARRLKNGADNVDMALLEVDDLPKDIHPLRFASRPVEDQRMSLTMVGHPLKDYWKIENGTLLKATTSILVIDEEQWDWGGSGSPILNDGKEVVGMVYAINDLAAGIVQVVGYSLPKLQLSIGQLGQ